MHLIVDIGNSKVKTALFDGNEIKDHQQWDSLGAEKLMLWIADRSVTHTLYADVRGTTKELTDFLQSRFHAIELTHELPLPIHNLYNTPHTLGKDRIAGAAGAVAHFPGETVLVIDMGTSVTYDLVDAKGQYLGGQISPGLHMRFKALHTFTGKLPLVGYEQEVPAIGTDTLTSIRGGVMLGLTHEIDGFITQYKDRFSALKVILTGGDAPLFVSRVKSQIFAVPQLILSGLNKILQYNVELDR